MLKYRIYGAVVMLISIALTVILNGTAFAVLFLLTAGALWLAGVIAFITVAQQTVSKGYFTSGSSGQQIWMEYPEPGKMINFLTSTCATGTISFILMLAWSMYTHQH